MKLRSLLLGWIIVLMSMPTWAQEVDVTTVLADTKTFIFDNGESTVKGYVYAVLEAETNCCGDDRIYLEVKIDPSGYVLSAKPLTGSNDCFKQSAVDIVKNIRWDAAEFKGPKSVYFEIKPNVECVEGRENTYVALEIFNNELLAPGSTSGAGESAPQVAASPTEEEADPEVLENLINVTVGEAEGTEEPASEGVAAAEGEEATFGVVTDEPAPRPADPPATAGAEEVRVPTRGGDPTPAEQAEAERVAQQQELEQLRSQLENMREQEEARRRELAAREEARRAQEEAAAAAMALEDNTEEYPPASDEGDVGELWLPGGDGEGMEGDGSFGGDEGMDSGMGGGDEDRLREEIERLRQERIALEETKRQREADMMRAMEDTRRDNEQIIRLEEEIAARQEEAARVREEMELRRLEEERMQADEARMREEEEYQRMMDEINRLQAEAQAKIAALEAQKADLNRMAELAKKREQEIALERAIREKERQKRLEEVRIGIMSSGMPITSVGSQETDLDALMANLDLSAEADSEALEILVQQIQQMKLEMARLQNQIRDLGGEPATSPVSSSSYTSSYTSSYGGGDDDKGTARGGTTPTTGGGGDGKVRNGATDTSWRDTDYRDPNVDPSLYPTVKPEPAPQQPAPQQPTVDEPVGTDTPVQEPVSTRYDSRRGYTNNLDDEHENTTGPTVRVREYITGRDAMKQKITDELAAGGVCGLAQALFSVTVDPQGKVVSHDVLGANTTAVELQLMTVLPTLQFQPAGVRFNQTLYLEFKAEVPCEGQDRINLRDVDPLLDTDN